MLMSVIDDCLAQRVYSEIAGARVLITGLSVERGVDVARAFADHGARLLLQVPDTDAETTALLEMLSRSAKDMRVYVRPAAGREAAIALAQTAAQAFGGFDVVVNIAALDADLVNPAATPHAIEDLVSRTLQTACHVTRVAANRMAVTWIEGLILNVVATNPVADGKIAAAVEASMSAALAAMTRGEAGHWADQAIRINGVGPSALVGTPVHGRRTDVARLALFLASRRGSNLSGLVFDVNGVGTCAA